jgi:hypothetical protein
MILPSRRLTGDSSTQKCYDKPSTLSKDELSRPINPGSGKQSKNLNMSRKSDKQRIFLSYISPSVNRPI